MLLYLFKFLVFCSVKLCLIVPVSLFHKCYLQKDITYQKEEQFHNNLLLDVQSIHHPSILLDARPRLQGFFKIGSAHPSFCLPESLITIGSLVFSETQHGDRGYLQLCVTVEFFRKNPHWVQMTKNGPKTWFLDFLSRNSRHYFCLEFV